MKVLDRRVRSASVKDPIHRRPGNVHYRSRTVLRKPPEVVYAGPANETPERYGVASVEEIIARLQASHQKAAEAVQLLTAAENTAMQLQGQMAEEVPLPEPYRAEDFVGHCFIRLVNAPNPPREWLLEGLDMLCSVIVNYNSIERSPVQLELIVATEYASE